ncbi:MAG: LysE family translocator [Gammaproteobacteria bacterium]|nr:LysE family translocator [Gammaproteobacteria bacterium]MDH3447010.1 LysE family translocator [Gammaproteobacteria bacterium]
MPLELWLAYVVTSMIVLAIPGPTILLVLSYSVTHGRQATLPLVTGVALGDSVAITLSLIGLGTLLATSALMFTIIKWLGGLYLIYLGFLMLRGAGKPIVMRASQTTQSAPRKLFVNAFIVTALNPKSIVFFIALLPQFISAAHPVLPQLWILGVTFVVLATLGATGYALFATSMRRLLTSAHAQKAYGFAGGGLLCAAGIWALGAKRVISAA